jgi:hypothetical protein
LAPAEDFLHHQRIAFFCNFRHILSFNNHRGSTVASNK